MARGPIATLERCGDRKQSQQRTQHGQREATEDYPTAVFGFALRGTRRGSACLPYGFPALSATYQSLAVGVPHTLFNVPGIGLGPRPMLTEHGITHRRVPTALIDSQLYLDSHYFLRKVEELGFTSKSLQKGSIASLLGPSYVGEGCWRTSATYCVPAD
jgi:hypothetical protein